jgi:hypothetical protein
MRACYLNADSYFVKDCKISAFSICRFSVNLDCLPVDYMHCKCDILYSFSGLFLPFIFHQVEHYLVFSQIYQYDDVVSYQSDRY